MNIYEMIAKQKLPCHWNKKRRCKNHHMCNGCKHQPPNEEKTNGKNPPMECVGSECPACGEPTYRDSVCVFCGQKLIRVTETKERNNDMIRIKLDEGAKMPNRAHPTDAGLDLFSREEKVVPARGSATFDTGVHIELEEGTTGFLKSKSGLNVKHGITSEGVIDVGYTGSIVAKLYNHTNEDYLVREGDKITQLVIVPIHTPPIELVDSLEETDRGDGGFGSTGR